MFFFLFVFTVNITCLRFLLAVELKTRKLELKYKIEIEMETKFGFNCEISNKIVWFRLGICFTGVCFWNLMGSQLFVVRFRFIKNIFLYCMYTSICGDICFLKYIYTCFFLLFLFSATLVFILFSHLTKFLLGDYNLAFFWLLLFV